MESPGMGGTTKDTFLAHTSEYQGCGTFDKVSSCCHCFVA